MKNESETEADRLRETNAYLRKRLEAAKSENTNLHAEVKRLVGIAARHYQMFSETHNVLDVLREDANRVLRENGVADLHKELTEAREKYDALRKKRREWMDLTRRSVQAKANAVTASTGFALIVDTQKTEIARVAKERDSLVANAEAVVEAKQKKLDRIEEQCRLWRQGKIGFQVAVIGILCEMEGDQLPEPGSWERAKSIRTEREAIQMRRLQDQMAAVDTELKEAGVGHPLGARGVHDLSGQRDAALADVDEWKAWEARARAAAMKLLGLFGHGEDSISARLQAGQYDEAIELLQAKLLKGKGTEKA